jgi:small subunit ribosomal protein S7
MAHKGRKEGKAEEMILMADEVVVETKAQVVEAPVAAAETEAKPKRKRTAKPKSEQPGDKMTTVQTTGGMDTLLFGKYSYNVEVRDLSLRNYINLRPIAYPMTYRRGSQKSFSKANLNVVERVANSLMRGGTGGKVAGHVIRTKGRLQGKKITTIKIIERAFAGVSRTTGKNPLQVLVCALENSAPIEDTTRVVYGGIKSNVAVDISASRRMDVALRNISMAAITGSFANKRTISEALASELVLAANADINSYAIKRKNEVERMARSAK